MKTQLVSVICKKITNGKQKGSKPHSTLKANICSTIPLRKHHQQENHQYLPSLQAQQNCLHLQTLKLDPNLVTTLPEVGYSLRAKTRISQLAEH